MEEIEQGPMLCAIDAEFIVLDSHEDDKRQALARVSVIRGEGPKENVPFIDDYIMVSESIYDYLTEFSGIQGTLYG